MTYKNCKKLINNKIKSGSLDVEWVADMMDKLDVFLLGDRITDEQYKELSGLLK